MTPGFKFSRFAVLMLIVLSGCSNEKVIREVPANIIATKPCPTLYSAIINQFPEYKNNRDAHPSLFAASSGKTIVLQKTSDVYLTFISEGAGLANTFGWYAYDSATRPQSAADLTLNILFPHVSCQILKQGDMLRLGNTSFKAGTVIGFFLLAGGWEKGSVDFSKTTLFTDSNLDPGQHQQHVLFEEKTCGDIVLAFEDTVLGEGSDADFNDIIFTVTDNRDNLATSAFDLRTVVKM